jgi:hypothetical protein
MMGPPRLDRNIIVIPANQYRDLDDERDVLQKMRNVNSEKRGTQSPSSDGHPQTFVAHQKGPLRSRCTRPRELDSLPIPIALFVDAFGTFRENYLKRVTDPDVSPIAYVMFTELCDIFEEEKQRETTFHHHLSLLFGAPVVEMNFRAPGYLEGARPIFHEDNSANRTLLPSVLVIHAGEYSIFVSSCTADDRQGSNLKIYGAVCTDKPNIELLCTDPGPLDQDMRDVDTNRDILAALTTLRRLYRDLVGNNDSRRDHIAEGYDSPPGDKHSTRGAQPILPTFRKCQILGETQISFSYTSRMDDTRLVFNAVISQPEEYAGRRIIMRMCIGRPPVSISHLRCSVSRG